MAQIGLGLPGRCPARCRGISSSTIEAKNDWSNDIFSKINEPKNRMAEISPERPMFGFGHANENVDMMNSVMTGSFDAHSQHCEIE